MKRTVETVCGALPVDSLGHCQPHEHVFVRPTPKADENPALTIDDKERSLVELKAYRRAGGGSLVDAQPVGAGRDAEVLRWLSENSGVPIIASTGYHLLGFYTALPGGTDMDENTLSQLYYEELTQGMYAYEAGGLGRRTGIRAGIVKAAIPAEGPAGPYRTLLSAAARAACLADRPLMLHTEAGRHALEAVELCRTAGLRPERLLICHADRQASDWAIHEQIAEQGVFLEYDTIGRFKYHSDEDEIDLIRHMLERGCEKQLLLSLDTTAKRLGAYGGEISLCYLLEEFQQKLARSGISRALFRRLTTENPKRALGG